jgi:hypothetical protein
MAFETKNNKNHTNYSLSFHVLDLPDDLLKHIYAMKLRSFDADSKHSEGACTCF